MHKNDADDIIDTFMAEWSRARPDLDFQYLATLGRILRIATHLRDRMDSWLKPFGLTWEMFDLLASLQRSGSANGLRPTALYQACMLSSGATTNRIDRAEKLKLAARRPGDLTERGHRPDKRNGQRHRADRQPPFDPSQAVAAAFDRHRTRFDARAVAACATDAAP